MFYFFPIISDLFSVRLSGKVTRALFDKPSKTTYTTEPLREPKQRRLKSRRGSQIWKMDWIWLTASFPKMSHNEHYKYKQTPLLIPPQPYLAPSFPLSLLLLNDPFSFFSIFNVFSKPTKQVLLCHFHMHIAELCPYLLPHFGLLPSPILNTRSFFRSSLCVHVSVHTNLCTCMCVSECAFVHCVNAYMYVCVST